MADETDDSGVSATIRRKATRHVAPLELRQRIVAAVAPSVAPERARGWGWLQMGATLACAILATVLATQVYLEPADTARVSEEVLAAHVRSLLVAHLEDIASSDQHTVKPWFAGKLDFSPPVNDFSSQGFPLIGGRLDYIDKRVAAALVYRRHGHVINVFVWPVRAADKARVSSEVRDGFNVLAWSGAGLQFWLVSDVNSEELQAFSTLLRGVTASAQ